jgi:tetratricopeptide (TPR) repeat protein
MDVRSVLQRGLVSFFAGALAIGSLGGITWLQRQRLAQGIGVAMTPEQQEQQEILQMSSLRYLPSQGFGFNNLIADWSFLRLLQYAGDGEARAKTGYQAGPAFFEVITKRDPRLQPVYLFSSGIMSYDLGQPEQSVAFLQRGIDALDPTIHTGAQGLWVMKGLDYLLLLNDPEKARESYQKAAEWAAQSPDPEERKAVMVLERMSRFLATNPDSALVRFWSWGTIFQQAVMTRSVKTAERARSELLNLGATETKNAAGAVQFLPPKPRPKPSPSPTVAPAASSQETAKPLPLRPLPSPKPEKTE